MKHIKSKQQLHRVEDPNAMEFRHIERLGNTDFNNKKEGGKTVKRKIYITRQQSKGQVQEDLLKWLAAQTLEVKQKNQLLLVLQKLPKTDNLRECFI